MKLVLENIQKNFGDKVVLKNISFTFEEGKIYGLLGRNGAGKTTLFNCLSKEIDADSGTAYLMDDNGEKQELSLENLGYVFSSVILPEFLTGYEFIRFYMEVNKKKIVSDMKIDDYFDFIKLDENDRHLLIKNYSLGMKNKIQMLMFIITKPKIILLDEPLTALDVVVALEMKKMLRNMREKHILIFSTHILQLAKDLCDEIIMLGDGELKMLEHSLLDQDELEQSIIQLLGGESS
ncbi:MAG: ABC transporter ATP-binding protein [Acutalibacteraceae bacterium]|nr:ABC transporter ATP-binding protein [Acutalibacteraceae bacterium]